MSRARLIAAVGAAGAATLLTTTPQLEGMVLRGYKDPIGIVTACAGHTATAVLGKPYSREECLVLLEKDLAEHAEGIAQCLPFAVWEKMKTWQRAAFVSFAYNVGVRKFCTSSMATKVRSGDLAGACAELSRWVYAGGEMLPGLVKRRRIERDMCEGKAV